jgi:hypothetical protein
MQIFSSSRWKVHLTTGINAEKIKQRLLFQLVTKPQLNILTYRVVPENIQEKFKSDKFCQSVAI